jgi:hypothetical protein
MSIFLDNVREYLEDERITEAQALYLMFLKEEIAYPIEADDLMDLIEGGFIKSNRVSPELFREVRETSKLSGTIKANYMNDISKEVTAKLAKMFCMRNTKTGLVKLPGDEGEENPVATTAEKYLRKEGLVAYHFIIFLYLFPVKGPFNRKWEKHFTGTEYKGPKLRNRSKVTGSLFLKVVKNKDMGAFLYGTYLFIESSIQGDRSYITTIPKYLKEFDEWYYTAEELIKNADTVDDLFKRRALNKENRVNIAL